MTLNISISPGDEQALRRKASAHGKDLLSFATSILQREARRPPRSLDEIAQDIDVRRGGPIELSEEQIADELERAKHAMREERRSRVTS